MTATLPVLNYKHARDGDDSDLTFEITADGPHGAIGQDGVSARVGFPVGRINEAGWAVSEDGSPYRLNSTEVAGITYRLTVKRGRTAVSSVTFTPGAVAGEIDVVALLRAGQAQLATPEMLGSLTGLLTEGQTLLPELRQTQAEALKIAGVDPEFRSLTAALAAPTYAQWTARGQPEYIIGSLVQNGAVQIVAYPTGAIYGRGEQVAPAWVPVGEPTVTATTLRNRGPVYAPDVLRGIATPTERAYRLNEALALHRDRREMYLPAEAGPYTISHDTPASGNAGLRLWPGQVFRGDGPATVVRNAVKNQQYGHMFRLADVVGPHEHAQLLNFTLDQNSDQHLIGTVGIDVSGSHYARVSGLVFRNIPLAGLFSDSPEDDPTIGLIMENLQGFDSWGTFCTFFGAGEDFQIIGAHRYERFRDDAVAFQESARGYQRGHTLSGTLVGRDATRREAVYEMREGVRVLVGYSLPHLLTLYGVEDINLSGGTLDAADIVAGALAIAGSRTHAASLRYGAGRPARNITLGTVTARRTGVGVASIQGHNTYRRDAISINDGDDIRILGGMLADNADAGLYAVDTVGLELGPLTSRGNGAGGLHLDNTRATLVGGDYGGNGTQAGVLATRNSVVELRGVRAGGQRFGVYAASGSRISGHDLRAIGTTTPVMQDGGTAHLTGVRTTEGPLKTRGKVYVDSVNSFGQPEHGLGQQPGMLRAMIMGTAGGDYAGQAYARLASNSDLIVVGVTPAPPAGVTVTVAWEADA
ncbi:hypothetical protein L1280_002778 [Deinococcus sp. HSC-46F16]|uniref:hypothetical protein n=1 Tax=Deinococcus sp. HSC-46F16 TaxID=2910968 RepID=UPI0020A18E97|nr:hypothetical protein [Deinococcus sp. HSC-46F16]MCP2015610.1 hypothetical protein [Deinococcus sp. HSC-46F16]